MSDSIIEVRKLGKKYAKKWAIRDLSFDMEKGCVLAVLGPNGAGKTTTLSIILDMIRPDEGTSLVFGLSSAKDGVAIRKRVGYVPERPGMVPWMTVSQIMYFVANYYADWDWDYAHQLVSQFELDASQKVQTLSRGQEAKLSFLLALSHHPELLIIDDATSGLDTAVRRELIDGIISHMHDRGTSVLFATHLIPEIEGLADKAIFISQGTVIESGSIDEFKKSYRRVTAVNRSTDTLPILPEGVQVLSERRGHREKEWTVTNFEEKDWAALKENSDVTIDDLTLEEIYCARLKAGHTG